MDELNLVEKNVLMFLAQNGYTDSFTLSTSLSAMGLAKYPQVYDAINHLIIIGLVCTYIPRNIKEPCEYRLRMPYEDSAVHEFKVMCNQ